MIFNLGMYSFSKHVLILFILLSVLISCRTSKLKENTGPAPDRTSDEVLKALSKNARTYNFYTAKINGDVDTEDFGIKLQIGLWIQKDKYIFSTYKKLNFEAARSYITHDSIYIVNRLQRYYQAEQLNSIWDMIQMQIPMSQMQDVIVGNQIIPGAGQIIDFIRQENDYLMSFMYEGNEVQYTIDGYNTMVKKVKITSPEHGDITAEYEDFRNAGGVKRPYKNTIVLKSPDLNATIKLDLKEIMWDKDSNIQFSVPPRYERYGL